MSLELGVRPAGAHDTAELARLCADRQPPNAHAFWSARYAAWLTEMLGAAHFAAFTTTGDDGIAAAALAWTADQVPTDDDPSAVRGHVLVLVPERRAPVRLVLDRALTWLRGRGVRMVEVTPDARLGPVLAFLGAGESGPFLLDMDAVPPGVRGPWGQAETRSV